MDAVPTSSPAYAKWGSLALFSGLILLTLCGMEAMSEHGLPGMPRAWHLHQMWWWLLAVLSIVVGCRLLAPQEMSSGLWSPSRPGIRFQHLQVYTRADCPLCDEAIRHLEQHQRWLPRVTTVDIDQDPRLQERYGRCVPVVVIDGKVRFKGRVPVPLLRRLIEGTPPR